MTFCCCSDGIEAREGSSRESEFRVIVQLQFENALSSPDKVGFLTKKGAKRKNWKERWFVLKDNYVFYCKDEKVTNVETMTIKGLPHGIINLRGCTVGKLEGPTSKPHSFCLVAVKSVSLDGEWSNRTYYIQAPSEEEAQEWMKIFRERSTAF